MPGGDAAAGLRADSLVASFDGATLGTFQRTTTAMPAGRFRHGTVTYGDRAYVIGSFVSGVAESQVWTSSTPADAPLGAWTATTSLPEGRSAPVVVANGPHVYVIAGAHTADGGPEVGTGTGFIGDIAADGSIPAWRAAPALPGIETSSAAGAASATHLYITGGYTNVAYEFARSAPIAPDGSLGAWSAAPPLATGRAGAAMAIARGRVYVLGGQSASNVVLASVEVADIQADGSLSAWRLTTPMPAPCAFHGVAVLGGS
jgi:hypothetical protein